MMSVCENICNFSTNTYSSEKEGHVEVYHWLAKDCIDNREFGVVCY